MIKYLCNIVNILVAEAIAKKLPLFTNLSFRIIWIITNDNYRKATAEINRRVSKKYT